MVILLLNMKQRCMCLDILESKEKHWDLVFEFFEHYCEQDHNGCCAFCWAHPAINRSQ